MVGNGLLVGSEVSVDHLLVEGEGAQHRGLVDSPASAADSSADSLHSSAVAVVFQIIEGGQRDTQVLFELDGETRVQCGFALLGEHKAPLVPLASRLQVDGQEVEGTHGLALALAPAQQAEAEVEHPQACVEELRPRPAGQGLQAAPYLSAGLVLAGGNHQFVVARRENGRRVRCIEDRLLFR